MSCPHLKPRPGMERIGLGGTAFEYALHGFAVLPLDRGGKRPHRMLGRSGGVYHATLDPEAIVQWWTEDPAANIGVATGAPSALMVIDLDVKRGADGPGNLIRLMAERRVLFPSGIPVVSTPSGGMHLWLRWGWDGEFAAPERPNILAGVDIKGTGGLVVAPPSHQLISPIGRDQPADPVPVPYAMDAGCPMCWLPLTPGWMADWIWTAPPLAGEHAPGGEVDIGHVLEHGAEPGTRNTTLYRLACSLFRKLGTTQRGEEQVRAMVAQAWSNGDQTGMPWKEVQVIIESARRFINSHPDKLAAWAMRPENQFWKR